MWVRRLFKEDVYICKCVHMHAYLLAEWGKCECYHGHVYRDEKNACRILMLSQWPNLLLLTWNKDVVAKGKQPLHLQVPLGHFFSFQSKYIILYNHRHYIYISIHIYLYINIYIHAYTHRHKYIYKYIYMTLCLL